MRDPDDWLVEPGIIAEEAFVIERCHCDGCQTFRAEINVKERKLTHEEKIKQSLSTSPHIEPR